MARTENVILTNMCMIYDGEKVLFRIKLMKAGEALLSPAVMLKTENPLPTR